MPPRPHPSRARTPLLVLLLLGCAPAADSVDPAPSPTVYVQKRVFLTDNRYSGGQVMYADEICTSAARSGGLDGTWRPWLSYRYSRQADAIDGIADVAPWFDLHGAMIFESKDALRQGPTQPLRTTHWMRDLPDGAPIWTGSRPGGVSADHLCISPRGESVWTTAAPGILGDIARVGATGPSWTYDGALPCDQTAHLICVEQ